MVSILGRSTWALLAGYQLLFDVGHTTPLRNNSPRQAISTNWTIGQVVTTQAGDVQGAPSSVRPDVSAYLGVPFGLPPVGDQRFAPPVAVTAFNTSPLDASKYGPDCPSNHIATQQAYLGGPAGEKILTSVAQTGRPYSEDCLSLNIWTKPQSGEKAKAVLFWIFGGGVSIGNSAAEVYDGSVLADENDLVVVSVYYRVNMFGFPGGPGLTANPGLLDQRLGLKWTRDKIAVFGGDPSRITVFGQSAGGASTDWLSIMYPDDPIAHGFIPQSGTAAGGISQLLSNSDEAQQTWYAISENLGCGGDGAGETTVRCVKTKSTGQLLEVIGDNTPIAIQSGFGPITDDVSVPKDGIGRVTSGNFAKVPMLYGSTANEAGFLLPVLLAYTSFSASTVDLVSNVLPFIQPLLGIGTQVAFTCGASQAAKLRVDQGVTSYRYRYEGGNYTNTYVNFVGSAYHTAELPVVFGTAAELTAQSLVSLAVEGKTEPVFAPSDDIDTLCGTINGILGIFSGSTSILMTSLAKSVKAVVTDGPQAPAIKALLSDNSGPINSISVLAILNGLASMNL